MDTKLKENLRSFDVKYREHKHSAVFTVEESKKLKQNIPGMHCKCLFLKDSDGMFYLVGMPAEKKLDSKKFRELFGVKKFRFGTSDELMEEINLIPGSVSIFGAINIHDKRVRLVIDKVVWDAERVGFHPNINTSTLEMTHENLEKYYNSLVCDKIMGEL